MYKRQEPTVWENIFANDTSDKGLIFKIYKELTGLHSRKMGAGEELTFYFNPGGKHVLEEYLLGGEPGGDHAALASLSPRSFPPLPLSVI